jgi:MFS transporter, ACS family, hexuronate transporter
MPSRMSHIRWWMLGLLFLGTTLNYLDRIVFSFLARDIRADIHFDDITYGYITGAFTFAYMIGFLVAGKFIDRVGTRIGYGVALGFWSIAAALHSFARGALSLSFWRAMLGLGESGNFPGAIKSVAEWFPKKDRAFATGLFNAGPNAAAMFGPFVLTYLNARYGWRNCFLIIGLLGFVVLALWLAAYRSPEGNRRVSREELAYIRSDAASDDQEPVLSWAAVLRYRETWGFAAAKFLTDAVWWFYLWWLPLYLGDIRKLTIEQTRMPILLVYTAATVGSIFGGWISGALIRRGWPSGKARKTALLLCAIGMPISSLAGFASGIWLAVAFVSVATACHQGWSANLFTTVSDVFPKPAVASVVGIGGFAGGLGGLLLSNLIPGIVIQHFGYTPVFLAMGFFHLTALVIVHRLMGNLKPITVKTA